MAKKDNKNLAIQVVNNSLSEIGYILKQAREKKSYSLKNIREITCIPVHHIIAIEAGDRRKLPEDPFLIGFIKRYARVLGLNEQAIVEKYLSCKALNPNKEIDAFDLLFQEEKSHNAANLRLAKKRFYDELNEKSFLKVYHIYFFIVFILFIVGVYLVFGVLRNIPRDSSASYLVLEKNDNASDEEPEVDYEKIESWVGSEKQNTEVKKEEVENKEQEVKEKSKKPEAGSKGIGIKEQVKINKPVNVQSKKTSPVKQVKKTVHVKQTNKNLIVVKSIKSTANKSISNLSKKAPNISKGQELKLRPLRKVYQNKSSGNPLKNKVTSF
ncbi:MAG: helix-turn-helix domain-containing protein [Candidatus Melainabacteria bacterium]|nr:helix-turn-helix domain-containing protein [Candidatus Melainabacteria bacterium]